MEQLMTWIGPVLDVATAALLGLVLWRLGREPGSGWSERETRLQAIFADLRALVAQSEGLARDLDDKLAGRETRLTALLAEAQAMLGGAGAGPAPARPDRIEVRDEEPRPAAAAPAPADPVVSARRIEELAEDGVGIEEIARRVGVAPAEVRLVIGLNAARAARSAPSRRDRSEARAHA